MTDFLLFLMTLTSYCVHVICSSSVRCALCCEAVQPEASTSVLQLGFGQLLLVLDDGSACISAVCAGSAVADLLQLRFVV
jgi:hypothetical protein